LRIVGELGYSGGYCGDIGRILEKLLEDIEELSY